MERTLKVLDSQNARETTEICRSFSRVLGKATVTLCLHGRVIAFVYPYQSRRGWVWVVSSDFPAGTLAERRARSAFEAAWVVFELLGSHAREVILPLIGAWRYKQLFPAGSSLQWEPIPLAERKRRTQHR